MGREKGEGDKGKGLKTLAWPPKASSAGETRARPIRTVMGRYTERPKEQPRKRASSSFAKSFKPQTDRGSQGLGEKCEQQAQGDHVDRTNGSSGRIEARGEGKDDRNQSINPK